MRGLDNQACNPQKWNSYRKCEEKTGSTLLPTGHGGCPHTDSSQKKQTHRHREQTCGFQEGWGEYWEFEISRYKQNPSDPPKKTTKTFISFKIAPTSRKTKTQDFPMKVMTIPVNSPSLYHGSSASCPSLIFRQYY